MTLYLDIFGRLYDDEVPAFLETGTEYLFYRLHTDTSNKSLIEADTLVDRAKYQGHAWGPNEIGNPPPGWEDANNPPVDLTPGFGGPDPFAPQAPENTFAPIVRPMPEAFVGELICDIGRWYAVPAVTGYTYQWKKGGVDISGATDQTYNGAQIGDEISCEVTAINPEGSTAALSNTTTIIATPVLVPPMGGGLPQFIRDPDTGVITLTDLVGDFVYELNNDGTYVQHAEADATDGTYEVVGTTIADSMEAWHDGPGEAA